MEGLEAGPMGVEPRYSPLLVPPLFAEGVAGMAALLLIPPPPTPAPAPMPIAAVLLPVGVEGVEDVEVVPEAGGTMERVKGSV